MNYFNKRIATLFAIFTIFAVSAVQAATVDVNVTAAVAAPTLTLTSPTALDFGSIIAGATSNTQITINASAGAVATPTRSGSGSASGGNSGVISVVGNLNGNVSYTFAVESISGVAEEISILGGDTIPLTNAVVTTNSTASPLFITVAGPNTINVGGIIAVANDNTAGSYSGTITATVNYQ